MNRNSKGQLHGYQELCYAINRLVIRGNCKNGDSIGYIEWHRDTETRFHIK